MPERVVISGMGTVNPLGHNVEESWTNAINGVSGVGPITTFDASELLVQIACEVKNYNPNVYFHPRQVRRMDRFEQFALIAAREAVQQAGLADGKGNPERIGVVISAAIGGLDSLQNAMYTLRDKGPRRISPMAIPMLMPNGAAGLVSIEYGFHGPAFSVATACASASDGIGMAWLMLRAGVLDVAIAGGAEATITSVGVGTFDRLGAMSRRNEDYSRTPQPFDLNRDGLVMGEGAALFVLERESHAQARGAEILAELAGYAATSDAYHVTAPSEDGVGSAQAMQKALDVAGITPQEVDYINAHGTATQLNDLSETKAIKSVFGERAYEIPVSSTKSMTGHMMGATGALEAIFCVQAVRQNIVPPTINYETPDPGCDLDYVPNQAREMDVSVAMDNAFGFGGHNAVLVIRAYN